MTAVKTKAPAGAAFFRSGAAQSAGRRIAAVGLAGALLGGGLIMAPAAQAADLGWTPSPTKSVVGSTSEKGDHGQSLIDNLGVFPGQKVEYNIGIDLNVDPDAEAVTTLALNDDLPSGFVVDEASLRVVGNTNNIALTPRADYTVKIVDSNLKIAFSSAWIAAHVGADSSVPITKLAVSFTATVPKTAGDYSKLENVATQIVNGESFSTDPATILVPGVEASETITGVDGKAVADRIAVGGDILNFAVKLDGTFGADIEVPGAIDEFGEQAESTFKPAELELAYDVKKFGIQDTFDVDALLVTASDVRVIDESGSNVTGLFDVTVKNGVLSVLAKATGDRGSVPKSVLGKDYTVEYTGKVRDVAKSTQLIGSTVEVIDDRLHPVKTEVPVTVQATAPTKSAVVLEVPGVDAIPGTPPANGAPGTEAVPAVPAIPEAGLDSVAANAEFTYKFGSSALPANRLAPVTAWSVQDSYTAGDRTLHEKWSVVADTDILAEDGETVVFKKGSVLADQGNQKQFKASFSGDSLSVTATDTFLAAVNEDSASTLSWSVYATATRTAVEGTKVSNTSHEWSNGFDRAATATTGTDAAVVEPTDEPTDTPTDTPTDVPTDKPTDTPTDVPTDKPTDTPTDVPTDKPTDTPTDTPTQKPSEDPKDPAATKAALSIKSFVASEGAEKGAHSTAETALKLTNTDPVKISFEIKNTGKTDLSAVALAVLTDAESSGKISDLSCVTGEGAGALKGLNALAAGGTADCDGVLSEVKAGGKHVSVSTVVGQEATKKAPVDPNAPSTLDEIAAKGFNPGGTDKGAGAIVTASDALFATMGSEVKPLADGNVKPISTTQDGVDANADTKRGAVTGEAVSETNPLMLGGGILALLAGIGGGAALWFRRRTPATVASSTESNAGGDN